MLRYDPLWETMERKGISQYRLIKYYGFSAGQLNRLKKNSYVSTHTLDVLCTILNCRVEDILEFHLNDVPTPELGIDPAVAIQMSTNAEGPEVEMKYVPAEIQEENTEGNPVKTASGKESRTNEEAVGWEDIGGDQDNKI